MTRTPLRSWCNSHRQRAVHSAEVGDVGDAPHFRGSQLVHGREHRDHGVVDPHVDRPEFGLDGVGGPVDGIGVVHVEGHDQPGAAVGGDVPGGVLQTFAVASRQPNRRSLTGERAGGGSTNTGIGAGHDDSDHLIVVPHSSIAQPMPATENMFSPDRSARTIVAALGDLGSRSLSCRDSASRQPGMTFYRTRPLRKPSAASNVNSTVC